MPDTNQDIIAKLTQQIVSQGTTAKWQGSVDAQTAAKDMAKIMAGIGITDISQFGKVTQTGLMQDVKPDGRGGFVDQKGNPVDSKLVEQQTYNGEGGEYTYYTAPIGTLEAFGNKTTGQVVPNTYGERQKDNAFGGTYQGKGNTAYRVELTPDGKPVFYTTQESSSDAADWMPIVQLALAATGAGGLLGNAILGAGASEVAAGALGNAILGGATSGLAGGDILKGALLGGAGGALSGYLQGGPIDASNMTSAQFNDALETQLIKSMQDAGLSTTQISQWLENASAADIASLTSKIPVTGATDNLIIDAAKTPITANALTNVLSQVPTIVTTAETPKKVDIPANVLNTTTTADTTKTTETKDDKKSPFNLSTSDVIRLIGTGTTLYALNQAKNAGTGGPTQYDIVPVPTDWTSPQSIARTWNYPKPIDFGTADLLKGTQWEKYLNQSATPNKLNDMNYNQLLASLKSNKPVTINDVIAGITSQYTGNVNPSGLVTGGGTNANPLTGTAKVTLNNLINTLSNATVEDKVKAYNDLAKTGLSDADIRTAVTNTIGNQSNADWNYLQQLATTQNPAFKLSADALTGLQSASAQDKANAYNNLLSQGYTDAQIRGSINNQVGMQTDTDWQALQSLARPNQLNTLISAIGTGTPQQKAATYNQLLGQGFSDADILNAANAKFGQQSSADWSALQNLAKA